MRLGRVGNRHLIGLATLRTRLVSRPRWRSVPSLTCSVDVRITWSLAPAVRGVGRTGGVPWSISVHSSRIARGRATATVRGRPCRPRQGRWPLVGAVVWAPATGAETLGHCRSTTYRPLGHLRVKFRRASREKSRHEEVRRRSCRGPGARPLCIHLAAAQSRRSSVGEASSSARLRRGDLDHGGAERLVHVGRFPCDVPLRPAAASGSERLVVEQEHGGHRARWPWQICDAVIAAQPNSCRGCGRLPPMRFRSARVHPSCGCSMQLVQSCGPVRPLSLLLRLVTRAANGQAQGTSSAELDGHSEGQDGS